MSGTVCGLQGKLQPYAQGLVGFGNLIRLETSTAQSVTQVTVMRKGSSIASNGRLHRKVDAAERKQGAIS
jgi:hypothetical protein